MMLCNRKLPRYAACTREMGHTGPCTHPLNARLSDYQLLQAWNESGHGWHGNLHPSTLALFADKIIRLHEELNNHG